MELELLKAHHLIMAYDQVVGKSLKFHIEAYNQSMFDVPVAVEAGSAYSILNDVDGYATQTLTSDCKAENIGLDITLEKAFAGGSFFMINGSIFDSKYADREGNEHDSRYNSNYSTTFIGGKEWSLKKNSTLQVGLKLIYNGGARITPLLEGVDADAETPPWDWSRPYEERVAPYFRPDFRIQYRRDNPNTAWTLALDVQNVINRKNEDVLDRNYDPDTNSWVSRNQSGLTPILSFQIDW
jgi:hypothetical protein